MCNVWFIRHAESEANAGGVTSDPATITLTQKGTHQAQRIASAFRQPPHLIVVSPYLRTQQTALPTHLRFPSVPTTCWPVHEFTYLAPARCAMTTQRERQPWIQQYWQQADPALCDGDGAESFASFTRRVDTCISLLNKQSSQFIAIFSHGQFMQAVRWRIQEQEKRINRESMEQFRTALVEAPIPNGSILPLSKTSTGAWQVDPEITAHLVM